MTDFLVQACHAARDRVAAAAERLPESLVEALRPAHPVPEFAPALSGPGVGVIAEIKRASPSRGDIAPIPEAVSLAHDYVRGGAIAISVLTEPRWFKGSVDDLGQVAESAGVPVLRKDFIVDSYQIWESRALGASAVLLIVAALGREDLTRLLAVCARAEIDALVETHDESEVEVALAAHADSATTRRLVVGVNARNLSTLEVDPRRFAALRALLPADAITVAESGISGPDDVREVGELGADAVLVGEHLVTAADPTAATAALADAGAMAGRESGRGSGPGS